jgi:hypothetical protein
VLALRILPESNFALLVAAAAIKEGREAWHGENCCAMPGMGADEASSACEPDCSDACCAEGDDESPADMTARL